MVLDPISLFPFSLAKGQSIRNGELRLAKWKRQSKTLL
jgi:hypothetical protein